MLVKLVELNTSIRMHHTLKVLVLFLLVVTKSLANANDHVDLEKNIKDFITDESKNTRESLKSDMHTFFGDVFESLKKELAKSELKMESKIELIEGSFANLSHTLNHKFTKTESKLGNSISYLSQSFIEKLTMSDSKMDRSFGILSESLNSKMKPAICPNQLPMQSLFSADTDVKDIQFGTILYNNKPNSTILRKYWMVQESNTLSLRFSVHENNLGPDYQLKLFGISQTGELKQFVINARTPNNSEFTVDGFAVVVALKLETENSEIFHPSFRLVYRAADNESGANSVRSYRSQMITREGLQNVSYPHEAGVKYPDYISSVILIAPTTGKEFKITLKFMDSENQTDCKYDYLKAYSLDSNSTGSSSQLKLRPDPAKRYCGPQGVMSETIGYSTEVLLFFHSDRSVVGTGYKIEIQPA